MTAPARIPAGRSATTEPLGDLVALELHIARLRVAAVAAELTWAAEALDAGHIAPRGALMVLNDALDDLIDGGGRR